MAEKNTDTAVAEALPIKLDVTVWPTEPKKNLVGYASLKINDSFVVEGLKVLEGEKGLFVGMPSKSDGKGGYRDTAKPITKAFREQLTEAVITEYHAAVEKLQSRAAALPDGEKKAGMKSQMENGAKQAAAHNAARPAPAKGGKDKNAEH